MTNKEINNILKVNDAWEAPTKLMNILYDRQKRERVFKEFLKLEKDVSYDWFRQYFEEEQAERKTKKQDFTPQSLCELLCALTGSAYSNYDVCSGTGGITITKWWSDCVKENPLTYKPSEHIYVCEELSDRSIPFLLFNCAIRGMNAVVIQCDVLSRECKGIFFICNDKDDFLGFSTINILPYTEEVEKAFKVKFSEHKYKPLVETPRNLFCEV